MITIKDFLQTYSFTIVDIDVTNCYEVKMSYGKPIVRNDGFITVEFKLFDRVTTMTVEYHWSNDVTEYDVFYSLWRDSQNAENYRNLTEFCGDFGIDADSIVERKRALKIIKGIKAERDQFKQLLGDYLYRFVINNVEE